MMPTDTLPGIPMPRSGGNRGARWDLISECVWERGGGGEFTV